MEWQSQRFVRSDGTEIVVSSAGVEDAREGIVFCDGVGCDGFAWKYLAPALAPHARLVRPTYRGHGDSGLAGGLSPDAWRAGAGDGYGVPTLAADVVAAMDEVGLDRAVVIGHSMGVQVALETALAFSDRVVGLVLVCGSYGRPLDTVRDTDALKRVLPFARAIVERFPGPVREAALRLLPTELGWQLAQLLEVDGRFLDRADMIAYLEHMARIDQRVFLETLDAAGRHTAEDRLGQIRVPTLVVGGERDGFTPFWVSEVMAARIPGAELHMIRGGTHTAPLEHRELFEGLVTSFLERRVPSVWNPMLVQAS